MRIPMPLSGFLGWLTLSFSLGSHALAQPTRYHIQTIAPPPLYEATGRVTLNSLNDYGHAVGRIGFPNRSPLALLWDGNASIALPSGFSGGEAYDINNHDIIVGRANGYSPALWNPDRSLSYLPLVRTNGVAYAINDSDIVVGVDGPSNPIPVKWVHGQVISLCGSVPCSGTALDINNQGDILGSIAWDIDQDHYGGNWIYQPLERFSSDHPPTPDDFIDASVLSLNDNRQVAGYRGLLPFEDFVETYAIRWENGIVAVLDHGSFRRHSYAQGINNRGDLVGQKGGHATLWTAEGHEIDLNLAIPPNTGWLLQTATDINERGQIVGYGLLNNKQRGFLLTPLPRGDVNGDGCVDDADLLAVLFAFGGSGSALTEDVNGDGVVDDADLLMVLFNFGSGC